MPGSELDLRPNSDLVDFTDAGLKWKAQPTIDEYLAVGAFLERADQAIQFAIGDLIVYGEATFGEEAYQALDKTPPERQKDYAWVSRAIPLSRRNLKLTYTHHRHLASKVSDAKEQREWLKRAERERMTTRELKQALDEENGGPAVKRPTVREAAQIVLDYAHPQSVGEFAEWVVPDDAFQRLAQAMGVDRRIVDG